jgi:1,4-alpha-glucan branching enzyme
VEPGLDARHARLPRQEPVHRRWHHDELTFSLVYAWDENFVLPLSHDEVVHGKGSLLRKMPGDEWQQFANLRALYGHMWAHPGKQLLFMGGELGQGTEWSEAASLDWYVLDYPLHEGLRCCVADLNRAYREEPALWEVDFRPSGFQWLVGDARDDNVLAYARFSADESRVLACVVNFSPVVRHGWRVPLPRGGSWREVVNTDATGYGGSGVGNLGVIEAEAEPLHGRPFSAAMTLPPLAALWLAPEG